MKKNGEVVVCLDLLSLENMMDIVDELVNQIVKDIQLMADLEISFVITKNEQMSEKTELYAELSEKACASLALAIDYSYKLIDTRVKEATLEKTKQWYSTIIIISGGDFSDDDDVRNKTISCMAEHWEWDSDINKSVLPIIVGVRSWSDSSYGMLYKYLLPKLKGLEVRSCLQAEDFRINILLDSARKAYDNKLKLYEFMRKFNSLRYSVFRKMGIITDEPVDYDDMKETIITLEYDMQKLLDDLAEE